MIDPADMEKLNWYTIQPIPSLEEALSTVIRCTDIPVDVWGPSTGSSRITAEIDNYNRVRIHATTDFGEARCHFTKDQARDIADGLYRLAGERPRMWMPS